VAEGSDDQAEGDDRSQHDDLEQQNPVQKSVAKKKPHTESEIGSRLHTPRSAIRTYDA